MDGSQVCISDGFRNRRLIQSLGVTGIREPDMLTGMTERDWRITLEVFDAVQSSRGEPGHDDRKFLEAIHYFTVHSITWRALPKNLANGTAYGSGSGGSAGLVSSRRSSRCSRNAARRRI